MTFYELEKECKKRRFKVIVLLILILLFIAGLVFYFQKKPFMKKQISKKIEHKKTIKKKVNQLLPIIDLNITQEHKKNIKPKITKKNIIQSTNIPSFKTCLNLAKSYFEKKDYKNALKWAKLANKQDKKNPMPWIISAKALYKLGKKQEAIRLLKIYDTYYNNKEIKNLIKDFNEK